MKNPIPLFIFFIGLALSGLVLACAPLLPALDGTREQPVSMPNSLVSPAPASTRVRIVHTWTDHKDGAAYYHSEFGLGTAVEPSVILTHNHFDFPLERREKETLTLKTPTGQAYTLPMSDVAVVAVDAGTQLIYLPSYVAFAIAPVGDQSTLDQLSEGDWLTVDYWDEANQRIAQGNFQIKRIGNGVATLADPHCRIHPGASGGGTYVTGRLVGNTWAMYADPGNGQATGAFNVALLPSEVLRLLQSEQTSLATALTSDAPTTLSQPQ
jgi:hypothetical protein